MTERPTDAASPPPGEPDAAPPMVTPAKLALQILGFAAGIALLVWTIKRSFDGAGWDTVRSASPLLVLALVATTVASLLINGGIFWLTIRPVKPIALWDLQRLNVVCNMLNYAPIRLGSIARVLHHLRVDGINLIRVGAWFALVAVVLLLSVAACLTATLVYDRIDIVWAMIVIAQVAVGLGVIRLFAGHPFIRKRTGGIEAMAINRAALWGGGALRLLDIGFYTLRIAVAAAILQSDISGSHLVVLGVVALAAGLMPFGRLGFREFCVAAVAERLALSEASIDHNMSQLALVESAGEMLIILPLGLFFLIWMRRAWAEAKRA